MSDTGSGEGGPPRRRTNLGRGLDALFGEDESGYGTLDKVRQTRVLPIELVRPNPKQPRRHFDDVELEEMVASVREQGVLQPILVRPSPVSPDLYEIVAGERRWRAAQRAQLHEVPVVIRELDDAAALQIAIIENIQRQNLTALEEAEGYRRLMQEFGNTQEQIGKVVGKSRSHIANTLRLLELPEPVRTLLDDGKLSAGHGRALLVCADPVAAARETVEKGLNVRQTEALSKKGSGNPKNRATPPPADPTGPTNPTGKDADLLELEQRVSRLLGLKFSVSALGKDSGNVFIHYNSLDQLDELIRRLTQGRPNVAD
ncbi:MAG: ParB/RepB/Spo0J family partition protein [Inquilinus sp.]|nr:ParB/RepB/Spo0J family partition protein [Inquilinus sp.]